MTIRTSNEPRPSLRSICTCAVSGGVPRQSFYVAIVVGTILNLINQGDALLIGRTIDWLKIISTYAVPYCVCTYGAVSFQVRQSRTGTWLAKINNQ